VDYTLYILTGPTAVGKTEVALRWAEQYGAEILSADSLLFYKGMDIGTAKPTDAEQRRVRHHLIDIAPPDKPLNVVEYRDLALQTVRAIQERGKRVLITGGSGFYLKCFYAPIADEVEIPEKIVQEVQALFQEKGLAGVTAALKALDPACGESLDMANPRRVLPALMRCRATGKTVAQLRAELQEMGTPFDRYPRQCVCLSRGEADLQERIRNRADAMIETGLVDEVRRLRELGLEQNPSAASAIGYRETLAWLDGKLESQADYREALVRNTWQLVKKQQKWFRHQLPEHTQTLLLSEEPLNPDSLFDPR